jgi:hypothetical protein
MVANIGTCTTAAPVTAIIAAYDTLVNLIFVLNRKSYHGYAPGYAVVINSPTELQISPMQIDTWNRDEMDFTGGKHPKFVPGPLPRASEAPEAAEYSGLLECPMTTRLTKVVDGNYALQNKAPCEDPILTFQVLR